MFFATEPGIYSSLNMWTGPKIRLLSYQLAATNLGRHPEPTQYTRDVGYFSQELQRMDMEDNQPESAATGCGGLGADEEGVEASPFAAAGHRLPVHLNSSSNIERPGDPLATPKSSQDSAAKKMKQKHLSSEHGRI